MNETNPFRGTRSPCQREKRRRLWPLLLTGLLATTALMAIGRADEARTPDATISVSSSAAASALGLSLVEGTLRVRDKTYRLTLRGAQPTAGSTGKVYGLVQPRDIGGEYEPAAGGLRNERGVTIVFDPPLDLPGGKLRIDLSSRVYPKASTGQRGTVE
jgi:hypothetical protein